ncbi:glycosyl hydrolase family 28-related protein [Paracidobacterium acidisoli]|uniref:Rhamnogalacturonase A/B/Epimerase-like pectate lyase domain-containing protein n=1 Tax=Paracidobacterium acidisoli TaxID=2303751 RepID=A0A372INA9_9BACT|nr:glycosyl hydrolase family 28-related protein [Paracidobacterium acidisoli]MBT9331880.1 hypothetical protein [Paracidobacterium acidisoli]
MATKTRDILMMHRVNQNSKPVGRFGLYLALILIVFTSHHALAQVSVTTVQGTVYRADGTPASGTLIISWPAFTTAANNAVAAGSLNTQIGTDGFVSVNLAPNEGGLPGGSYYTATYHLTDGTVNKEYWVVPAAGTATISSVRAELAPSTVAIQTVTKSYVDSSVAAATNNYVPLTGATMSGPLLLSSDPTSQNQAATKHYADQIGLSALPLAGGSMLGTLSTPNAINKLPRIDVRHPDFGATAGCANAADPTGLMDSTCAINAAIAYAYSTGVRDANYPAVYIPEGIYKISSPIRVSCDIDVVGDGESATLLKQTNDSADGLVFSNVNNPVVVLAAAQCYGGISNLTIYAADGHNYTATLLEIANAAGVHIEHVRLLNSGGRGLVAYAAERVYANDLQIDSTRWPLIGPGNEGHFYKLNIASAGSTDDGFCWGANCNASGQYPNSQWTGSMTLQSAEGDGKTATFVISCSPASACVNGDSGTSPIYSGHWFNVSGITGVTALNGYFQALNVTNDSPSGSFTITAASNANGTGVTADATWQPTILPETHAAVTIGGVNVEFNGGSIKANWYAGCFNVEGSQAVSIQNFYCEGAPVNGQPHLGADLTINGLQPYTFLSSALSGNSCSLNTPCAATVSGGSANGTMWMPNTAGDVQDVSGYGATLNIYPADYSPSISSASAYVPGVNRNQYETVVGAFSNNTLYVFTRNGIAGAYPSWPANSYIQYFNTNTFGPQVTALSNHFESIDPPGSNWTVYCNDNTDIIGNTESGADTCGSVIAGTIPDGLLAFPPGTSGALNQSQVNLALINDELTGSGGSVNEPIGAGWVKVHYAGSIAIEHSDFGGQAQTGENSEVTTGQVENAATPPLIAVQYSNGVSAALNYVNSTYDAVLTNLPSIGLNWYESRLFKFRSPDPALGANPGLAVPAGHQFTTSDCWYDVGASSGSGHAQNRFCLKGSPGFGSNSGGWEYDTWNGSSWVNAFSISDQGGVGNLALTGSTTVQGGLTASRINGEITVDGTTYTTLNAAWTAAVALANSTGLNQTIKLGPGTFNVTTTMAEPLNGSCVNVLGSAGSTLNADSSQPATTLKITTPLSGDVFYLGNTSQAQGCTFRDLNILAAANATHGFELQWFRGLLIDNVTVNDTAADGIVLGEESTTNGHQSNFLLRNVTVSYNAGTFTPASRPAYGIHIQQTAIDSHLDFITVRNALTAAIYNEGTGNTGYLIHGFGYPYTCSTAPCANNTTSGSAPTASYATNYVVYDTGGSGSVWTDTYVDSPAVAGFYVGAKGIEIHGGHIQWPDTTSFPAANLAYVAPSVTNNLLIADVDCLNMASGVNWITYGLTSGNPPSFASVHHLTGCGNYYQSLEPANTSGFSSGGANVSDTSGAVPRIWSTPIAAAGSYPAYAAQMYTGYQGDAYQAHFAGLGPFFNITYQGTVRAAGGLATSTVLNTVSALTLTTGNRNVVANATSGPQTITLPSCYTAMADGVTPTGLELIIIKSDATSNAVTMQTASSQTINYQGASATTLVIGSAGKRTLVCGPDYNWYAY